MHEGLSMQFTFTSINISVCFVNLKIFGMFCCRLTNVFKEYKPHFVRVAAYIVADLLRYFETYTLYPEVKVSGCAHAINYCDGFKYHWMKVKTVHILGSRYGIPMWKFCDHF
jgi:hypothetical protein